MVELKRLLTQFAAQFGTQPRVFSAPGRVNIIGEHTDYNDGFVLPMAIDRRTFAAIAPRNDRRIRVKSNVLRDAAEFEVDRPAKLQTDGWVKYVAGIAWTLNQRGVPLTGADMMIDSDLPMGAGLSSSAALAVASGIALTSIANVQIDPQDLALAAQRAEHEFAGARVGIMDQLAVTFGERGHALLIDCRSLEFKRIGMGNLNAALVVCDTNVKHEIASSAYNQRRTECEQGAELLRKRLPGIRALRDVSTAQFEEYEKELPEPIRRRCRHVVTENERTLKAADALANGDCEKLGQLLHESHASLKADYEVSCRELDVMVDIASREDFVFGARMTGGGFGGCTINFVRPDAVDDFLEQIRHDYRAATNITPDVYLVKADDGAREEYVSGP